MDVDILAYYMISIKALSIISLSQRHWILIHQFIETKWTLILIYTDCQLLFILLTGYKMIEVG